MNATAKGIDMTLDTFQAACQQAEDHGESIQLGGGEPTLHPEFERFLMIALAHSSDDMGVWLATNGSQTERALAIAKLAKRGVIGAALSQDEWHDPIDPEVVQAFTREQQAHSFRDDHDRREIRSVTRIIRAGRAARRDFDYETVAMCACDGDPFVDPAGNVHQCGCKNSPVVGNVRDGYTSLVDQWDLYEAAGSTSVDTWSCYKEIEKLRRKMLDKTAAVV